MQLRNNQGQWCNRSTDQSDSRGKKRAGTFPGIPVSIKGADLHLHLISDLFLGAKGSVFKGSLSLLLLVMATVSSPSSSSLSFSLSNSPSFIFPFLYRLAAVGSSSLYQQQTLWLISLSLLLPFFLDLILQFLSCLKGHGGS